MKKIIVSLITSVLVSLVSQVAFATEPQCEEIKKCQDEVCEMVKKCSSPAPAAETKNKTIWREEYVCSGNFDPKLSKKSGKCVCKEPEKNHAYALARPWEEVPNKVDPSNPNVKYHRLYVQCNISAQAVLEATQHTMNIQQKDIVDLTQRVIDAEGRLGDHEVRIGKLEENDTVQDQAIGGLKTSAAFIKKEVDKNKADLANKADTEWVERWVNSHRVRLTVTGGVAYAGIPKSTLGLGVMDVAIGGLFGDGDVGLDVGGRFMFSPGGFNTNTYPGNKSGQTYGVAVYSHLTFALSSDKRTRVAVGGSWTQLGIINNNAERKGAIPGLDAAFIIPLSEQVVLVPQANIGQGMAGDGASRVTGLAGMISLNLGVTF